MSTLIAPTLALFLLLFRILHQLPLLLRENMASSTESKTTSQDDNYFQSNPEPKDLARHVSLTRDFVKFHAGRHRVVLVTSGGTTVPLEKRTVRFSTY